MAVWDDRFVENKGLVAVIGNRDSRADSVCAAIAYAAMKNVLAKRQGSEAEYLAFSSGELTPATEYALRRFGFEKPVKFEDLFEVPGGRGAKLVLVGHNDLKNAADGVVPADIIEIIDRHPLGGLKTKHTVRVLIEPVGATSAIVRSLYRDFDVSVPADIAALLLVGIITATAGLTTETATDADKAAALEMAELAGLDIDALAAEFEQFRPIKQFVVHEDEDVTPEKKELKHGRRIWR